MPITTPTHSPTHWFIFLWRSIDFLLFSLPLIPGSVSSVALYRRAIIQGLITAPLTAYLLPGDSLFKPLPNDLGKLTCSTSQGCEADVRGGGPHAGAPGPAKERARAEARRGHGTADASCKFMLHPHLLPPAPPFRWQKPSPMFLGWILQGNGGPSGAESILIKMSSGAQQGQCQSMFGRGRRGTCRVELSQRGQPNLDPISDPPVGRLESTAASFLFLKIQTCWLPIAKTLNFSFLPLFYISFLGNINILVLFFK